MKAFDIQEYITAGAEKIVADAVRATLRSPKEAAFMASFAASSAAAARTRRRREAEGMHVPTFLIASITSACNLHCEGCYSRSNHATEDTAPVRQLTAADWGRIFDEAHDLGISFILLAGGEPLLRRSVIEAAGERRGILFPIFTNGTYLDEKYFDLFEKCRNLVPVISLEGGEEETDRRRGAGVYDRIDAAIDEFRRRNLLFGASVTVTTENLAAVTDPAFIARLTERGCRAVFFVEYVPVTDETLALAPGDEERETLTRAVEALRAQFDEAIFLQFPGDEKASDGCLAAGRGFFHINSHGGAEPCPFSPYSDVSVKDRPLADALSSPLFTKLRDGGLLEGEHEGGCTLFARRADVAAILQ